MKCVLLLFVATVFHFQYKKKIFLPTRSVIFCYFSLHALNNFLLLVVVYMSECRKLLFFCKCVGKHLFFKYEHCFVNVLDNFSVVYFKRLINQRNLRICIGVLLKGGSSVASPTITVNQSQSSITSNKTSKFIAQLLSVREQK